MQVKHQISDTDIGTKLTPLYAYIFINNTEIKFLQTTKSQPLVVVRYIDNVFFILTHAQDKLVSFTAELGNFHSNKTLHFYTENISVTHNTYKIKKAPCFSTDAQ